MITFRPFAEIDGLPGILRDIVFYCRQDSIADFLDSADNSTGSQKYDKPFLSLQKLLLRPGIQLTESFLLFAANVYREDRFYRFLVRKRL